MKKYIFLSIVLLALGLIMACSGQRVISNTPNAATYYIEGMLVEYLESGEAVVNISLKKDGDYYTDATITLAGKTLETFGPWYKIRFNPSQVYADSTYTLAISDGTDLDTSLTMKMPDSITVQVKDLPGNIWSGGAVDVEWTLAVGSSGYLIMTKPDAQAITDSMYEAYEIGNAGTIPIDAFKYNDLRIVGTHYVYTAAFIGAPVPMLDFPDVLPSVNSPADNYTGDILSGRLATMVISAPDSVIVEPL